MRNYRSTLGAGGLALSLAVIACSGSANTGFQSDGGATAEGGLFSVGDSGAVLPRTTDGGSLVTGTGPGAAGDSGTTVTVIYANTDTALYSLDPQTNQVSLIGTFSGLGGGSGDDSATDCAVNAEGDVYINSESVVYRATLPSGPGSVVLTKIATIKVTASQAFYALAFAPPGVLGSGETLVGGDGNGELWSIDTTSGAISDLGNFGPNPSRHDDILALSGDIVFYLGAGGAPTGLATIRSCASGGDSCTETDDYLAGIDMTALSAAFTSGTPAPSLLSGIYGGATGSAGPGTGYGKLFGLGAWEGSVFGFGQSIDSKPPNLVTINSGGAGSLLSSAFSFTDGWSGAGVSTKTTVTIVAPPPIK